MIRCVATAMMSNARERFREHQVLSNVHAAALRHARRRAKAWILRWIKHKQNCAALA